MAEKPENAIAKKGKDAKPEDGSDASNDVDSEDDEHTIPDECNKDKSEEEEDTPTPKWKRSREVQTPVPEKKAKLGRPHTSAGDAKKEFSIQTATPHPKNDAKTAEKSGSKPQTPKTACSMTCKVSTKSSNIDGALKSHTKTKNIDAR